MTLNETVAAYTKRVGITRGNLAMMLGMSDATLSKACQGYVASVETVKKLNDFFKTNFKPFKKNGYVEDPLPSWIKNHPEWKRNILEQEWYVNPERAEYFAIYIQKPEDVQKVRAQFYTVTRQSNMNFNNCQVGGF